MLFRSPCCDKPARVSCVRRTVRSIAQPQMPPQGQSNPCHTSDCVSGRSSKSSCWGSPTGESKKADMHSVNFIARVWRGTHTKSKNESHTKSMPLRLLSKNGQKLHMYRLARHMIPMIRGTSTHCGDASCDEPKVKRTRTGRTD